MKDFQHKKRNVRLPGLRVVGGMTAGLVGLALAAGTAAIQPDVDEQSPTGQNTPAPGTYEEAQPGMGGSAMENQSALPPNVSPGWKIRVCSEKTKAEKIQFKVTPLESKTSKGMGGTEGSGEAGMGGTGSSQDTSMSAAPAEQRATWTRGESTEVALPAELRDSDRIRIEASPFEKDQQASICLIYDDHVAKKLNFDDHKVSTVRSSDNGECGC
jgi:hypothetical protein